MSVEQWAIFGRFKASVLAWLAFLALCVTFILYVIAFSTMGWAETGPSEVVDVTSGLWRRCISRNHCFNIIGQDVSAVFAAAQAFAIFAFVFLAASLVLMVGYIFVSRFNKDQRTAWAIMTCAFGASLAAIITCATFVEGERAYIRRLGIDAPPGVTLTHHLGYSFGLCVFSLLLSGAAGGLLLVEQRYGKDLIPA